MVAMIAALLLASWAEKEDGRPVEKEGNAQVARAEDVLRNAATLTVHLVLVA